MVQMPHWPKTWPTLKKYDLARIEELLTPLDKPHLKLPPVIHVAGTNGKGSTVAMFKSIFKAAGYKAHIYTSPHLIEFNERIEIAGSKITDDYLFEIAERVRIAAEKIGLEPTFFEATTIMALLAFSEIEADIVLLETGMGGRLDSTNIIPQPLATIITPISYDHMEYLGPTLPIIAGEKAGIIKQNTPCFISKQMPEVMDILLSKCEEMSAPAIAYEYDFIIDEINSEQFLYKSREHNLWLPCPSLRGHHQILNACTVVAACLGLGDKFRFTHNNIACGLQNINWPGRIQKLTVRNSSFNCWIDGAHNAAGAECLASWMQQNKIEKPHIILGLTKNRSIENFLAPLKALNPTIYCVRVKSEPSSYSGEYIAAETRKLGLRAEVFADIEEAIRELVTNEFKGNIIITGSLFLVADSLKLWR